MLAAETVKNVGPTTTFIAVFLWGMNTIFPPNVLPFGHLNVSSKEKALFRGSPSDKGSPSSALPFFSFLFFKLDGTSSGAQGLWFLN